MTSKQAVGVAKDAISAWLDDRAPSMGAALAYYTIFSIAPLLLIAISVAGLVFGADTARGEIVAQMEALIGTQGGRAIEAMLQGASKPQEGSLATVVATILLIVGATSVFAELQDSLDRIWRAPARKAGGLWGLLRARLLSFGMVLCVGFLLLVSLLVSAWLAALGKWWDPMFGGWKLLAAAANFVISFALVTVMFAMIYKVMPRVRIRWHDVWIGAAVTALLFTLGKSLIGLYIGKSGVASAFGAVASPVLLLLWVYYSAQIFLLGAEFTWVYARRFGSQKDKPADAAAARATPAPPSPRSRPSTRSPPTSPAR